MSIKEFCNKRDRPFYLYDIEGLRARVKEMQAALKSKVHLHFAVKANFNLRILKELSALGVGADVVSGGELLRCLEAGFKPNQIIFSGVGKTGEEIKLALNKNIKQLNVESVPELERIISISKKMNLKPQVALRLNPDVNPNTHPYICTGFRENKFGLDSTQVRMILNNKDYAKHVQIVGLTMHIGSQILDSKVFAEAIKKTLVFYNDYPGRFKLLDAGGGLGINYQSADLTEDSARLAEYATTVLKATSGIEEVLLEPGRFLIARFGSLYARVEYVKKTEHKNFLIVNSGMHHLIRPALYEAYHRIEPVERRTQNDDTFDVVGPICESADTLGKDRRLPIDIKEGDWLRVCDAGAYGFVMSSQYNLQGVPDEFFYDKGEFQ
jgi:diaminopimelate decarboxylase